MHVRILLALNSSNLLYLENKKKEIKFGNHHSKVLSMHDFLQKERSTTHHITKNTKIVQMPKKMIQEKILLTSFLRRKISIYSEFQNNLSLS